METLLLALVVGLPVCMALDHIEYKAQKRVLEMISGEE